MKLSELMNQYGDCDVAVKNGTIRITGVSPRRWIPFPTEKYYRISSMGHIESFRWEGDDDWDRDHYEIGNVFQTEEEARKALERHKIQLQLRDLGAAQLPVSPSEEMAEIYFVPETNEFRARTVYGYPNIAGLYFSDLEQAWNAIRILGGSKLMKLIGGCGCEGD